MNGYPEPKWNNPVGLWATAKLRGGRQGGGQIWEYGGLLAAAASAARHAGYGATKRGGQLYQRVAAERGEGRCAGVHSAWASWSLT